MRQIIPEKPHSNFKSSSSSRPQKRDPKCVNLVMIIHFEWWQEEEMSCRIQYFSRKYYSITILLAEAKCLFQFWQILSSHLILFTPGGSGRMALCSSIGMKVIKLSSAIRCWPIVWNLLTPIVFSLFLRLDEKTKLELRHRKHTKFPRQEQKGSLTCFVTVERTKGDFRKAEEEVTEKFGPIVSFAQYPRIFYYPRRKKFCAPFRLLISLFFNWLENCYGEPREEEK